MNEIQRKVYRDSLLELLRDRDYDVVQEVVGIISDALRDNSYPLLSTLEYNVRQWLPAEQKAVYKEKDLWKY